MALNTPKRVRTLASFGSSPPPSHGGHSPQLNVPPHQQSWNQFHVSSGQFVGYNSGAPSSNGLSSTNQQAAWMDGSLSPVSSCDSPEFHGGGGGGGSSNRPCSSVQKTQKFYPGTGVPVGPSPQQQQQQQQQQLQLENSRRGRPRSEALTTLMFEGSTSPSAIKCTFCNRVFPREKSLQAHLRTHTGERPYPCDYPGCHRAFTQSGQLKTHQRLHTGERPFMCSSAQCKQRFTHANRHCPDHPYDQLKRCDDVMVVTAADQNREVLRWLEKYITDKEDRTPTRKTPRRSTDKQPSSGESLPDQYNQENRTECLSAIPDFANGSPSTPSNTYKCRKGLMLERDMNAGLGASPVASKIKANPKQIQWTEPLSQEEDSADEEAPAQSTFNPKKRWLREAWQDDLARPLESAVEPVGATLVEQHVHVTPRYVNPNEMRPSVLMVAIKDRTMPLQLLEPNRTGYELHRPNDSNSRIESHSVLQATPSYNVTQSDSPSQPNRKWLGAMALMQLASNDEQTDNTPSDSLTQVSYPVAQVAMDQPHGTQQLL